MKTYTNTNDVNTTLPTLAVMDGEHLYLSTAPDDPRPVAARGGELWALCEAAARRGVSQLWIVGVDPHSLTYTNKVMGWDLEPAAPASWIHAVKAHSSSQVDIAFPALMVESRDTRKECWHDAPDAPTLLAGLMLFRSLLRGQQWHRSSGATAARLLRRLHRAPRAIPLELPYEHVTDWPAPMRDRNLEAPIAWYRPLAEHEWGRQYLHRFDKNGAFLGALGQVRWGSGQAKHVAGPPSIEDTHGAGYALVELPYDPARIPAFMHGGRKTAGTWRGWVTMPTLRFMQERGELVRVWEHYIWPESHVIGEGLYKLLAEARKTLMGMGEGDAVVRLALAAVKGCYASFTGGYMASVKWDRAGDTLYRPDVRHAIMATARVSLVRRAEWVYKQDGASAVAIGNMDTIYFVSDDRWPVRASAQEFPSLRVGVTLRDFKPSGSTRITGAIRVLLSSGDPAHKVLPQLSAAVGEGVKDE